MTFFEYLSVLRRRWLYVAVGLVVGAVAGFITAPGNGTTPVTYRGTHTLLIDRSTTPVIPLSLDQAALLASTGPVPARVRERLDLEGLPPPGGLSAAADSDVGSLRITASARSAIGASRAADITAEEINVELANLDLAVYNAKIDAARIWVAQAQATLDDTNTELNGLGENDPRRESLENERERNASSVYSLQQTLESLEVQPPPIAPFRTLEAATGRAVEREGWQLPTSRPARALILAVLGLFAGGLGALAADRLDGRVRGKDDAERAFDLPVIAEIPPIPGGGKTRELLVRTAPASPVVESFRALRTVVLFSAAERSVTAYGSPATASTVILVTSPAAGEGKTTTAAHLAALLAEVGHRTLIVSGDFRRPRMHELFGVPRDPGLSDVLASGRGAVPLAEMHIETSVKGVSLLPSGSPVDNPARLLTETAALVEAARAQYDFIVIDTPPLLVANDATELAGVADMVILVAKANRTSRDAARRATEVLRRIGAPLLGVVVSAAHDTPTAYGYYRNRYYSESDQGTGVYRRFWQREQTPEPADVSTSRLAELRET